MIEIDPRGFRVLARYSDSGGHYVASVDVERGLLFRAILTGSGEFSEGWVERIVPFEKPTDLDWSEWMLVDGYGSTPDFAATDLVLVDGETYLADVAEDVYLVGVSEGEPLFVERVEVADLEPGDRIRYQARNGETVTGRIVSVGPVDKYPHLAAILVESGDEMLAPYTESVEVVR